MAQKIRKALYGMAGGYPVIGINSQAFADADALFIDGSGWLTIVTTTSRVIGFSNHEQTMSATNQTVALVTPLYTPWLGVEWQITADQAGTQTDNGAYADLVTVTSGAQQLNLVAGTSGQFHVLGFDPDNDDSNSEIVVEVAEPQQLAFAQA